MRLTLSLVAACLLLSNVAEAAGGCGTPACGIQSHSCGNCSAKTCKVVCEMVKVKKTVWVVECEEFCPLIPGCGSTACGGRGQSCDRDVACGTCCGKDPCAALHNRTIVPPECGKTRCRKKLVKKEVTCEVPVYKCVVAECCSECGMGEAAPVAAPSTPRKVTTAAPLPPLSFGG
jgi:hypothetical protein